MLTKGARRYLREVRNLLPGKKGEKEKIVSGLSELIRAYTEQNRQVDYSWIVERFGTPQQVAASCLEEMDALEISRQISVKKRIIRIVMATSIAIMLFWVGVVVSALIHHRINDNGYMVDEIIVVDRVTFEEGEK